MLNILEIFHLLSS